MNKDQATTLGDHIQEHAAQYFPELVPDQTRVQLVKWQKRPSANLYNFRLTDGTQAYSIIAKVPVRNLSNDSINELDIKKPLLFPKISAEEMSWFQYTALVTIHHHLTGLNRPELGAIRVLDYLPESKAIVMEESSDPKLRDLIFKESRLRTPFGKSRLLPAFQNVGKWLRTYHNMPKTEQAQVRDAHREDFVELTLKLTNFLKERAGDVSFFDQLASTLAQQARDILPESLPLGLGHGDYALRNILVSPSGRVTVLDTFANWRTPIYKDIGYFLMGLKMTSEQVASHGLLFSQDRLQQYERAFIKGYFEQRPVPLLRIRLYEMFALLDKWSSVLISSYRRGIQVKAAGDVQAALISIYFKRKARHLLYQITGGGKTAPSMDAERSY